MTNRATPSRWAAGKTLVTRFVAVLIGILTASASAWAAEEIPYREFLSRNSASSSKLSLGMTREQVLGVMGDLRSEVRDGQLANPWKVEAFLRGEDAVEVLYYLVRGHPPFTPILQNQAISVVLKNGKLVAWGRNADAGFR